MVWLNRWRRAKTRRGLAAARRAQERDRDDARQRLAGDPPDWNGVTARLPVWQAAPLLTPGQRDRSGRRP
ncbi:hypothetical protein AB0J80_14050 [Actinoplanes sp. NPDC049548]|uniref:hypothetical protein n=1 Tax=Actinoplanes sp. NPDC049548 TaxID=3155152 RepID=UPI003438B756